jgi:hypothetical protein
MTIIPGYFLTNNTIVSPMRELSIARSFDQTYTKLRERNSVTIYLGKNFKQDLLAYLTSVTIPLSSVS